MNEIAGKMSETWQTANIQWAHNSKHAESGSRPSQKIRSEHSI